MAYSQQPRGTTVFTDDPIEVFTEWARQYARVKSSVPVTMQGNLVTIQVRPNRGNAGKKLDQDCIRQKLENIAGMEALKPMIVEKTCEYKMVDRNTGQKVDKKYKMYTVHLDPDNWTDEDTARGYKKSRIVIRTSVNDEEDKRLLGGSKPAKTPKMKHIAQVQPLSQIQAPSQIWPIPPRQPIVQTESAHQTQRIAHIQPVHQTQPIAQAQSIAEAQPTLPRKPIARSQPAYQTQSAPHTQPLNPRKPIAQSQPTHQTEPMPQIRRATGANQEADVKETTTSDPKIKIEEGADPNILDEYIVEDEPHIKAEPDC